MATKKSKTDSDAEPVSPFKPALKPNRPLLIASGVILAAWIGVLLVLYFTTIYPKKQGAGVPEKINSPTPTAGVSR